MPALLLPPGVHGVPVAPGPAIFPDGAFPPVPTATSSAVPEVSGTPASTPTALPPVRGRGYISPPGVVDSEISRLLSKPVDLSVPTSTSSNPQKRDAVPVAADGNPEAEALTQEDLSIPDNQSPLQPVGNEYSHDTFWHLEQPRIRFGYAKRAERTDRFGNPPGWPIPFSVGFDEYVLKLDEPYAPPKPSTRGKDIATGGEDGWNVAKTRKVKRGEEMLVVPEIDIPLEKGRSSEGWKPTRKEPAGELTTREQILGLEGILSEFSQSAAAKEALRLIKILERDLARKAAGWVPIRGSELYLELEDARIKGWLVKDVYAAIVEYKAGFLNGAPWGEGAVENKKGQSREEIAAAWEEVTRRRVESELERLGLATAVADGERAHAKLRAIYDVDGHSGAPSKEEKAANEVPKKKEAPKEEAPKEETPKEEAPKKEKEEEGHALEPRGNGGYGYGDPNFSDHRLERKKKKGGSREQEEQPLEYNFNVEARLDNEEKSIWPFKDGMDDVMYHESKGQLPRLCVIL